MSSNETKQAVNRLIHGTDTPAEEKEEERELENH